jgi:hypothetical protein
MGEEPDRGVLEQQLQSAAGRQVRMHSWVQSQFAGNVLEQFDECPLLMCVESPPDPIIEIGEQVCDLLDDPRPVVGQTDVEGPPIMAVPVPPHQASSLQVVDQRHHVVAVDAERVSQLLLRLGTGVSEVAQHAVGPRCDTQRRHLSGEQPSGLGADLREQEGKGRGVT